MLTLGCVHLYGQKNTYSPNRKGEHPQAHLANYSGTSKPMPMAGTERFTQAGTSSKHLVGLTHGDPSGSCTRARASCRARLQTSNRMVRNAY